MASLLNELGLKDANGDRVTVRDVTVYRTVMYFATVAFTGHRNVSHVELSHDLYTEDGECLTAFINRVMLEK